MEIPLENCNTATTQRKPRKKLKFSSNLLVDRNGKVVPLQCVNLREKIATLKGNKKRCKRLDVRCKMLEVRNIKLRVNS